MKNFLQTVLTNGQPVSINLRHIENFYPPKNYKSGEYSKTTTMIIMTTKDSSRRVFEVRESYNDLVQMFKKGS